MLSNIQFPLRPVLTGAVIAVAAAGAGFVLVKPALVAHQRVVALNATTQEPLFSGLVVAASSAKTGITYVVLEDGRRAFICATSGVLPSAGETDQERLRCSNLAQSLVRKTIKAAIIKSTMGDLLVIRATLASSGQELRVSTLEGYRRHFELKSQAARRDSVLGLIFAGFWLGAVVLAYYKRMCRVQVSGLGERPARR